MALHIPLGAGGAGRHGHIFRPGMGSRSTAPIRVVHDFHKMYARANARIFHNNFAIFARSDIILPDLTRCGRKRALSQLLG
jgi:hypothetical protein